MSKTRVAPWQRCPCATCGTVVQATRGEAREINLDSFECGECEARESGYREGRAAAYAEIVAVLREKWPPSVGASWAGLEAAVVGRVIDEIEARAKEQGHD